MIAYANPYYWGNERKYALEAIDSTWISGGPFVDRLEREYAAACGSKFAIAVSNGTCALHMAFLGLGLKAGDEVIIPGFSFLAAANIALHMGLKPVFVEVDKDTWCMDVKSAEKAITSKTKAIIPIHTYGNSCAMQEVMDLSSRTGIPVIEDAAEAIGTQYDLKWVGSIGHVGCFSFHATKTIATGEGGIVVTNDPAMNEKMRLYRSHGMGKTRYFHDVPGHNFRMTNIQAAIGCGQLEHAEEIFEHRKKIHGRYFRELYMKKGVSLQVFPYRVLAVPWMFACLLDESIFGERDEVISQMYKLGIEVRPGFYSASLQPIYGCPPLPTCEYIGKRVISLPGSPPSDSLDVEMICSTLLTLRKE